MTTQIDWKATGLLVGAVVGMLVLAYAAWKVAKVLFKVVFVLLVLATAAAAAWLWMRRNG
jgi:hypothetical protein